MGSTLKSPQSDASSYWASYLAELEPCEFPRLGASINGPRRPMSLRVNLEHVQRLQKLSVSGEATLPSLLRVAWGLLLRCYTGLDDVCFGYQETGTGTAGNERPRSSALANGTPAARFTVDDMMSVADTLERVKAKNSRWSEHQPFDTAVVLRRFSNATASNNSIVTSQPLNEALSQEYKIRVLVKHLNGNLTIFMEWWSCHMSMEQAKNVASTFDRIVSIILLHPQTTVGKLDFFSERNKLQVLKWNSTPLEKVERCVHEVIQDQALRRPDFEAVCSWDGSFTYKQLDEIASRLAGHLMELGVGPEIRVPLCFEKSKWTVVAMLAVMKAGGAFVPLDPSHPIPRLQALARSVDAALLLCSRRHMGLLGTVSDTVLPVDDDTINQLTVTKSAQISQVNTSNAAYLMFTSGSTGEPKGTVVEHVAYCSGAKAHASGLRIAENCRVLQFAAHTFDASLVEILTSLMQGACVCIPSEDARLNDVVGAINGMRVNHAVLTPSFIGFVDPAAVPTLQNLVLAGEAMSQAHVRTWSKINLVNGYGPTEASVAAAINSNMTAETDCKDIGFPVGVHCWIADPSDHHRLVPVGCIGELLLEGPTLARCYLNNTEKTSDSFVYDLTWSQDGSESSIRRRFYKTGDLVRYNSAQGSLSYVGRKDTQVKFHGQRIELGEIEHHLGSNPTTKHGLVLLPKTGQYKQRLVAVLSLSDTLPRDTTDDRTALKIMDGAAKDSAVAQIREDMSSHLPPYMLPSTWLCVEDIPMLTSSKLDRKSVTKWVEDMNMDLFQQSASDEKPLPPATDTENQLRMIWCHVLNISPHQIGLGSSFLSLGGDSITAMTCMGQAKRRGIGLTVQDILRSKSLQQLATCVKTVSNPVDHHEILDSPFELSPIQQLHFQVRGEGQGHFNQSFFLRFSRKISEKDLRHALDTVVGRHSMLRARFSQSTAHGAWQQCVTQEVATSYRFRVHRISSRDQVKAAVADSQACLDVIHGPLSAVDLFDVNGQEQLVSLIGHHLVIDLVSWRVILEDVEEILLDPKAATTAVEGSLPFQTWCRLQTEHCQSLSSEKVLPLENVPGANLAYWGMEGKANTYGEVACEGFEIDAAATTLLLTECHESLRTETVDILLSALLHSFCQIFTDRSVPAVYNEGHGREPFDSAIDITRTVGWFTVVYPVFASISAADELVDTAKRIKDLRRRVPDNGRPYFASRFLSSHGKETFSHHYPMEITFNYLGQYQQLERAGALLQPFEAMAGEAHVGGGMADFGFNTPRFGLFEISAVIAQGKLRFSFTFNRYMRHQDLIRKWISHCQRTLLNATKQLTNMKPQPTLSDFPLLSLTYESLKKIENEKLPQIGLSSIFDIEDAYPCSPMQQGLLLSRSKDTSYYVVQGTYEVKMRIPGNVNVDRLADAWQMVVNRHAALRTVFVESLSSDGLYDQVVWKNVAIDTTRLRCDEESDVLTKLSNQKPMSYDDGRPPHRFSICQTSTGRVFCKLELSHTIMDGASMSIIFRELGLAYAHQLPDSQRPLYSSFIAYLQNQPDEAGLGYWKSYLADLEPCHFPLLNDGITVSKQLRSLRLDFEELPKLQSFCDSNGLTLSNAFHTAWSLTIRSYIGCEDACFGYLTSGRDAAIPGAEAAVGPFINMLVCRAKMLGSTSLNEVLNQVQQDYMDSLPYRHTSLAEVQHALRLSGTALFNTCLSYRKLPPAGTSTDDNPLSFSEYAPIHDPTEYLVSINIEASESEAAIDLDYWTDALSDGQAANVASTFIQALRNIVYHSEQTIACLDHLRDNHKDQIWTWNRQIPETINDCVHQVIERQAKARPEAEAICAWDGKFSYAQLDELSGRLATYLMSLGITPETLVPTCFDKSAWTIISMLAVLKAGGGCVPLDATHPNVALETRVINTEAHVVLASPERAHIFEDMVPYVIPVSPSLLDEFSAYEAGSCANVQPDNPSFVIFTSGSTGQPKGVVLEHRAIVTSAEAHGSALGVGPQTRFLQFAAYTFDNSLEEIFTTLMRGGCVCVPSDHDRFNDLAGAINQLNANFMDLTPTVATFLQPSDVPTIKEIALGGEALTKKAVEIWGKSIPVHNQYGPSECSINSTHNRNAGTAEDVSNIGRSVGSVSWVVDPSDHNSLVPVGCVGELLIEGPILARGYLNDGEQTAKSFIENPAWVVNDPNGSGHSPRRMYKTGDLVRYNSDGSLSYLGRKDTQIKLNGQRIELGEIEHHIKTNLSNDAQSAVELIITANGPTSSKALAAFLYLPRDNSVPSISEPASILPLSEAFQSTVQALEAAISSSLPNYMVPSMFIPVSRMPLVSSGKLDRRTLRTMAQSLSEEQAATFRLGGKSGRAPSTTMEKEIQQLFATVLTVKADSIGADDSFFRHGGDSIGAMRLVTAARSKGINLTVASIFQTPKLSDLARGVSSIAPLSPSVVQSKLSPFALLRNVKSVGKLREEVAALCRVHVDSIQDIYPCTSIQEGLVALSSKQPGAYVAQTTYRLPTNIDIPRFRKAWQEVADTEVVLRTRIVFMKDLGFLQVVVQSPITWDDSAASDEEIDRHLPPHDGGILCRYTIVGEGTHAPLFVWTAHHALYDGWSLPILLSRVESRYTNPQTPANESIPSYPRFIEYLSSIDGAESDAFWQSRLAESTSSQFPQLPNPAYEVQATSLATHTARIKKPRGMELTVPSILRAAWALVMSIYSNSDDVVFGEILTGRDAPVVGIEDMVGPTLATVPTRICIDRQLSVADFLADMQKQLSAAMPYQFAGLQHIKRLSPEAGNACQFQNLLAISHADDEAENSFWNMISSGTIGTNFYTYPLNISCTVGDGEVNIDAHYDQEVVPTWLVSRLLHQFETILSHLTCTEGSQEKIGEMELLSSQDQATVTQWNAAPLKFVDKCIHHIVQAQALSQPNAIAVCSWDATFTFQELDRLATSLAHHLVDMGIGREPEIFVPLCFEKSAFTIVAMLAVLKAGAAFVPIDPAHPVARLQEIVSDIEASLVLCSPRYQAICEAIAAQTLAIDNQMLIQLPVHPDAPPSSATDSAAYVIFTSGTTGKPKGSLVEHSAFCSGAMTHGPAMLIQPTSRVLQFASYTFDASMMEILTTLMIGGCVCVPNEFDRMNNITTVINQMKVDLALLTPSFAQLMQPSDVPRLSTLILGGEAMSKSHLSMWAGKVNLVNAYGPSECSVIATVNSKMTPLTNPANIGHRLDRCWIVDAHNHHRLAPIGSVGELLVEGPTLARGYLNNQQKTAEAFIKNPRWSVSERYRYPGTAPERRMYKTGDLVKVCSDISGEMIFLGRKDTQAKVNGQRLELEEIEHHLNADDAVQHVLVAIPKSGCCAKRLVAVLSIRELATSGVNNGLNVITWDTASPILSKVQERLRDHLPAYMIPSKWVVLRQLPLQPSGKLDRRQVLGFIENMNDEVHAMISVAEETVKKVQTSSGTEQQLQEIWGHVLNLAPQRIGLNQSFLHLGGDSISAMQVMARCRSEGMGVTVQDIIRSKSISDLASRVSLPEQITYEGEDAHEFDLSPIQQLYFSCVGSNWAQFNQSILLRSSRKISTEDVTRAVNAVVKAHSMLRARFRKDGTGNWKQRITTDIAGSYRFRAHNATTTGRMKSRIEDSQRILDIQKGPVVAVDLFNVGPSDTRLFITAHHLVIDVVSWRIILQDLEDLISSGTSNAQGSLPFQAWCRLQIENAQQQNAQMVLPHHEVPVADLGYWEMVDKPNVYGDVVNEDIELDSRTSTLLLGSCHQCLQTDAPDILLAAILLSFRHAFPARETPPAVYNEGHGREPWESKLELSRTVGWFTTLSPVYLPTAANTDNDLVTAIKWVKDFRRRLPEKGRSYFAYRLLTSEGKDHFGDHWPMEIAFNYLGQMQQLERTDSLLQPVDEGESINTPSDIAKAVPRFALIEISAAVAKGCMKLSFSYNKQMKYQSSIAVWVAECQSLLRQAPDKLMQRKAERTLSDFPLLPLSYYGLGKLMEKLPEIGVSSLEEIEDIYPCSPMQRGILLSQIKNPEKYAYQCVFEVQSGERGLLVDIDKLERAWRGVVQRHATLRTVFVDSVGQEGLVDQVVIRQAEVRTARLRCSDADVQSVLAELQSLNLADKQAPHRLAFCETTTGRIICKLEISHVISDGSSMPILLRDLAEAYAGIVPASKNRPRYSDYIAYLQSIPREEGLNYWKAYLADLEPCSFPALVDGATKPQRILGSYVLNLERVPELQAFCTNAGVTLSNLLQLAWALVIRCYTGSDEVCFGYLASGRDMPVEGIEDAVGAFINMLICRINLEDGLELDEALDKVQLDFVSSMAYQSCSLAEVQHELNLSGTSLFNTAFTYQKRSNTPAKSQSALLYDVMETHDPSEYSIAVNVEATDSSVEVHFSYWTNTLSHAQAKNVASTFEKVLSSLVQSHEGERTVGDLDFFSEHSYMQVRNWNKEPPQKVEKCVHDLIGQQALRLPLSTPAVFGWDANFTYTELETVAARLATHLVGLGVGPETYVPMCFEKSAWAIVAQLGILKAGGAFVPLDPSHPESRLRHLVNDVGGNLVLCSPKHKEKASKLAKMVFVVDGSTINKLSNLPATPPSLEVSPSDPAYVIFTSGTTGLPKGTVIEHASVSTSGLAHSEAMFMRSSSRVLQFASYTFDACIIEILWTLLVGGCICVPSDEDKMNDLAGAIRKLGVTWACLTPSVASTLSPKSVPNLKVIASGGEAMPVGYIEKWADSVSIVNAYGPTEVAVVATTSTKSDEQGNKINDDRANIGTAKGGRAWIVDARNYNRLVPVGAIGELLFEGTVVARGYLNNEKKTAEFFVNNPEWARKPGFSGTDIHQARMYRTGDLVRYNCDGTLCYLSRKDTQVKVNGQRIELSEIEYHCKQNLPIGSQPAVDLVVPTSRVATKALAVFFSPPKDDAHSKDMSSEKTTKNQLLLPMDDSIRALASDLEVSLAQALPTYMIPQLFIPVSRMPWLTSGKLDRKSLREMVQALSKEDRAPYRLATCGKKRNPSTDMEKKVQRLWETVLRLSPDSVGAEDNFFRLGGESLAAMSLVGAARSQSIALSVTNIFKLPKLADMAKSCEMVQEESVVELKPFALLRSSESVEQVLQEVVEQCRVEKALVQDIYPTSSLQESLITLTVKQPGAYVAQNVFQLSPRVDIGRFKLAWQQAVDDLDTLRTRVVHSASSAFLQVVIKGERIEWHTGDDLRALANEPEYIPAYNGGPLARYTIINDKQSTDCYFVWSIHHALYDGWSLPFILQRVESAYRREISSQPQSSYARFIQYLLKVDIHASDKFWRSHLAGASSLNFPQAPHAIADQARSSRTLSHHTSITRKDMYADITVATTIRAAWTAVVAAYTGSDDVVFGETLTGRNVNVQGIADIVGPTLTTVPTRIQINRSSTVLQFLREVHHMGAEIIPHQHLGLQHIRRLDGDAAIACDFQNLLVIQTGGSKAHDSLWELQSGGSVDNFFTYPLVVECRLVDDEIEVMAYYDENVISTWQVKRMLHQFEAVLKQLSDASKGMNTRLSEVEVFSAADNETVDRWNHTKPQIVDECIHDLFKQKALSQPAAQAVCAWDDNLTYQELHDHASRLALYLVTLGVGPEVLVPICMDKSAWTVVAILGILIAGAAFCPLDPAHPISRHQELLGELATDTILCSPAYAGRYSEPVQKRVLIDKNMILALPALHRPNQLSYRASSNNTAYVIFTSGSTGRAKGVVIEHRAFCSSSAAFGKAMLMKHNSRVFQFASLTFDAAVMEILTTLTFGGCICIPLEEERLKDTAGVMRKMSVTWTCLTPSVANLIEPSTVPSLEVLASGGEAMPTETVTKWAKHVTLMNAYGPAEGSVVALVNARMSIDNNPSCIGQATAATLTWIVDPANHDRLAPLGAVGELVLDGPTLARQYLKNPEKTMEAFIDNPAWSSRFTSGTKRIYKTGDLVKYAPDGTVHFIGRKDKQVKLNGQRMELGEIENRLDADSRIRHTLVLMPKLGPCKKRLVAVLSLSSLYLKQNPLPAAKCVLVREAGPLEQARKELAEITARLSGLLPAYMIPQVWVVVEDIPMLVSGKLDRKQVDAWIGSLDEETYEWLMGIDNDNEADSAMEVTETTKVLQDIWARVLNLPIEKVRPNQSFLSLGGDSITAMGVMARGRKENINLSLQDILQAKSISKLALRVGSVEQTPQRKEKVEELFDLSPIQKMYFQSATSHQGGARFNQSFSLRITRKLQTQALMRAIEFIVDQHSMLRARFSKNDLGVWQQLISKEIVSSYRYRVHYVDGVEQIIPLVADTQACLNPQSGPLLAADLFNVTGQEQIVFLTAHHLCVDMVSWRIILQDLQEFLESGPGSAEKPISFQTWCAMQAEQCQRQGSKDLLPFNVVPVDLAYWGMYGQQNTYSDVECETLVLDKELTALAFGDCHKALKTEPLDLFLSTITHSFSRTFSDRATPTLYNESHGRESPNLDLSRTVGWFTTICPLHVSVDLGGKSQDDVLDTLRRTKDTRRRIPENGRPYFAHRFLNPDGRSKAVNSTIQMEVVFNYLGRMQQLERTDSLLTQTNLATNDVDAQMMGDVGPDTARFALFEVSAVVTEGKLQFSFMYNRHVRRARDVPRWIAECRRTLEETVKRLASISAEPTLSDYPLMPIDYAGLRKLVKETFPQIGIKQCSQVEDVYPCSSVQEGVLLSQLRDPDTYLSNAIFEARHSGPGIRVDAKRIGKAWQKVVDRHAALRSVFIDGGYRSGAFDQVVVKNADSGVLYIECDDADVTSRLESISIKETNYKKQPRLPHQLTVCTTSSGRIFIKAEINHAVIDGGSITILLRDLTAAYENRLEDGPGPLYSEYIRYIRSQASGADTRFWTRYLKGIEPCYFPQLYHNSSGERRLSSAGMKFNRFAELQTLCEKMKVTLANVMHAAWALVLRKYTKSDDVCFGYVTAGRDAPVDGIQDTVGVFINMLCCRIKFATTSTLSEVFSSVQDEYLESLPYQRCPLAQVQHDLGLSRKALYNTSLSVQNHSRSSDEAEQTLVFEPTTAYDPSEYVVTVNVETERNEEGVMFRYWTNIMSDEQAAQLARTMADVLESFVNQPGQTIAELDPPKQGIETQIIVQSQPQPPTIHTHHTIVQPQIEPPTIHTHHTVVHNQVIPTPVLDNNATLKKMVSECVQQVIGEMLKSGLLLPRTPDVASIQQQEQQQELQVVHSTDDEFEVNSPVVRNPKIHLDPYHFAGNETNVRRSMARQLSKRGRSAATEKKLLAVWSLMLDIPEDSISGDDSFFELGGDSITAMKLVGAAREEGLTLTVADVFRHPTFDDMAAIIRVASLMGTFITDADLNEYNEYNAHNNAIHQMPESEMYERFSLVKASNIDAFLQSSICPKVGVFKGGIADVLPVTDFQSLAITGTLLESRWMLNYFYLDGAGALDLRLLKQSCFRLVQAFDILRTVFLPSGDRFLQVVLRKMRPDFQVFETEQDLGEFTTMLQQKDRDQGPRLGEPFVQFTVAKQKDSDRHRIFVRISHAQYDGICLPRILAALQSGYQLEPIPPTPSFADYVRASASTVTSDHYQHWKRLLKGSSMTEIVRRSGPNYRRSAGATMSLKQNIHLPSVAHGNITTATVVKAAWALVLAQLSARSDVVFGHTISGRNAGIPGVENIIGPCLNLVPVRVQFEPHWTALDLLRHVQDQQVANMPYEALGFREITKHCTEWPDWTNFTTAVQHQNVDRGTEMQLGDNMYTVGAVGTDEDFSDFSILSTPLEESDMLEIRLCFSLNGVITKVFAEQVLGMLCNAAESFSARPNTILPSPNELCSLPRQAVDEVAATSDDLFQSNALQNLSRAELLVLSDILSRAWRQVLRNDKGESTAGAENLQLDNSFFELGGDIMGLAQVAWLLEQEGFKLRVEDLIDHPTMLGQMAVLGLHIATERQKVMEAHIPLNGAATPDRLLEGREPLMLSRVGKSRTFGKAVGLAKRMVKKNARTHR